jgi:hypothetical protein
MHFISTFKKCTQESKSVNPRIFVGAAAGVLAVILAVFTLTGTSVVSDVGGGFFAPSTQEVQPLRIDLFDFSIMELTEKQATLEIKFKVSNPNVKSVMLQHVKYSVYHNDVRISIGELGSSPEGFLASPNYYIITTERPVPLGEKFTIINTGQTPELWDALTRWKNSGEELNWRISGEAFYNLSSLTAGYENILEFDFSKHD